MKRRGFIEDRRLDSPGCERMGTDARARVAPSRLGYACSGSRGFSLLEAVLALAVFSFAVVALFRALNEISLATNESAEALETTEQLRSYLTEVLYNPQIEPGQAEVGPDELGLWYQSIIEPVDLQNAGGETLGGLYRVEIRAVQKTGGGGEEIVDQAEAFRYGPLYQEGR